MQLLNPIALLLALTIPLIILFYILKPRYQEKTISSTFLWEKVIKDLEVSRPWQKLQRNILLFLQIMAAFLLALALSRPFVPLEGKAGSHIIAVIDCSSSMMATDVRPNRFEIAKGQIEDLIDKLGPYDLMTIVAMGEESRVMISASDSKIKLRQALQKIEITAGSASWGPVLEMIESLVRDEQRCKLVVFTDGGLKKPKNDHKLDFPVDINMVGEHGDNIGIITLASRKHGDHVVVLTRLCNYGSEPLKADLELRVDKNLQDVKEVELKPGITRSVVWEGIDSSANVVQVKINRPDYYMLDNEAYTVVKQTDKNRVLLVTTGNIFLEKSLGLLPDVELYRTTPENFHKEMTGYQFYVFDRYIPAETPRGGILFIDPSGDNVFIKIKGEKKGIYQPQKTERDHPLLKYVETGDWRIASCKEIKCPAWCRTVLESKHKVPLMVAGELNGQRIAVISFDLHNSNIPLKTGFPILINNLAQWILSPEDGVVMDVSENSFRLGHTAGIEAVYIEKEGKQVSQYHPPFPASFTLPEPGLYQVTRVMSNTKKTNYLAWNSLNPQESNIAPVEVAFKADENPKGPKTRTSSQEIWPLLVWAILLILVVEWEVYRRGY